MPSKRAMFIRDRQRNCPSRKRRVKALLVRQQQQADLVADLWSDARKEEAASDDSSDEKS